MEVSTQTNGIKNREIFIIGYRVVDPDPVRSVLFDRIQIHKKCIGIKVGLEKITKTPLFSHLIDLTGLRSRAFVGSAPACFSQYMIVEHLFIIFMKGFIGS